MKKRLLSITPPPRIALDLRGSGLNIVLTLLALGEIESGDLDKDQIAQSYEDLSTDDNLTDTVRDYFNDQMEAHPWSQGHFDELIGWADEPGYRKIEHTKTAQTVARYLSTLDFPACEALADLDLLGRVRTEMIHQAQRRKNAPGYAMDLYQGSFDMALSMGFKNLPKEGEHIADMWADSGMRLIGTATMLRAIGQDPQKVKWTFADASALNRALIAVNAIAFDLGDNIHIEDGSAWKEATMAAYHRGEAPARWYRQFGQSKKPGQRMWAEAEDTP